MKYTGSCHCGRIAFEVDGELQQVIDCNCSICARKGALLWMVPRASLKLLTPEADIATYSFGQQRIRHRFCPHCGIHPFGEGSAPDGQAMAAINVRCLEDIDLAALPVTHFNGRDI